MSSLARLIIGPMVMVLALFGLSGSQNPQTTVKTLQSVDPLGTAYGIFNMKNVAAAHRGPDVIVRISKQYDPSRPLHLVVYNHGFYTDIADAYRDANLAAQMATADSNSILLVPEWQKNPGAQSGNQGNFANANVFKDMVQETFDNVRELKGKTLADVDSVTIIAHSGGYNPAETEIYSNGLLKKVFCIALLDALYDPTGFDTWLHDNIKELNSGSKRFYNFYYGTRRASEDQAQRVKDMLKNEGLPDTAVFEDTSNGTTVMSATEIANRTIVFKYTDATAGALTPHFSVPNLYVGPIAALAH